MSTLSVKTLNVTNTLSLNSFSGNGVVVNTTSISETSGNFVINTISVAIGTGSTKSIIRNIVNEPSINVNSNNTTTLPDPTTCNVQIFTSNGTWVTPDWYTNNGELVIVYAWGAGGGGNTSSGAGGGALMIGYYMGGTDVTGNVAITVGNGGSLGIAGENSVFAATNHVLTAFGGGAATSSAGGGGAGWLGIGSSSGGSPLGGAAGVPGAGSTFGGGGGGNAAGSNGGFSVYGGGGGALTTGAGGNTVFGGGGGTSTGTRGTSVYGGFGGNTSISASSPGGGGAAGAAGARGEVRVYTIRKFS